MRFELTGPERKELREILLKAFKQRELRQALAESEPARDFDSLVSDASYKAQVFELIGVAEREGWLSQIATILERERADRLDLIAKATTILERPSPAPSPTFSDNASRELAEALEQAHLQHEELTSTGQDASAALEEILAIKRRMREGGPLQPGDFLSDGRFRLLELIGRGGFANVFKAYDRKSHRLVAIKVLHGQYAHDRSRRDRFFRGARKMADLQHEGIVRVIETRLEEAGYYFFVMEYCSGGDLRRTVLEERLEPSKRLHIVRAAGAALDYAHRQGIVHRDVKPANVLLDDLGQPKLTDFDLVQAHDSTGGTRTGMLGTIVYAAPEAMEQAKNVGVAADVFGLGMTAIFVLHGCELPVRELLRDAPAFARDLEVHEPTREALAKAVAWEAEERQASVAELCAELEPLGEAPKSMKPRMKSDRNQREQTAAIRDTIGEFDTSLAQANDWQERARIFQQIPTVLDDAELSLLYIGSRKIQTSNVYDLFFLDQAAQQVGRRWPETIQSVSELCESLYTDREPPPEDLFVHIETLEDGTVELWREIEAGHFRIGSPDSEPPWDEESHPLGSFAKERPQHEVSITRPFQLMAVPVTNAMYRAFDPEHEPEEWQGIGTAARYHPVVNVDWFQASAFCRWLGYQGFFGAQLPSEAQWEYACRAGTSTRFWSGASEEDLERVAWSRANAASGSHRVGAKPANPWGLYDMHGNVWEWCADGWDARAYAKRTGFEPVTDPRTDIDVWNIKGDHVLRGGAWGYPPQLLRAACRGRPWLWSGSIGFRVCISEPISSL